VIASLRRKNRRDESKNSPRNCARTHIPRRVLKRGDYEKKKTHILGGNERQELFKKPPYCQLIHRRGTLLSLPIDLPKTRRDRGSVRPTGLKEQKKKGPGDDLSAKRR